ncbi:putative helicase senataxin [Patagioenas fasciata monilis]|uniref:Putative helicase senataxin n=1 Tax=Patagioenas fasciata monilis TaxID=372326 RepID=A0A1V4J670_PATFA|nr:putative helicase senataxin [Patagioenas fasciata monilis]
MPMSEQPVERSHRGATRVRAKSCLCQRMSTCQWCTPSGPDATEFLKSYASQQLSPEDFEGSNDDLCYCLDCVVEYHKAREKLPNLHEVLWDLETSRLVAHMEKSMQEEAAEDDELFIVDENGETQLSGYLGPDFENNLRVPLLEILKYPYLLLHEKVSELCVEVLCRMEQSHSSFQVFEKYPGIYLFLVHPNEVIRRWAILTARNLGKVDRDDYYDLQEVLTCLFKVIELGLFESPDIYSSSMVEKGKLILLPSHLYDTANYKNYWLGICMLLTVLEEQAMDSLLLGPDKQNDFMQTILHTMEKETADDSTDPFWPALHCFMVILDQLGSKVWGQLIDPVQAFQTIINSLSYNNEINNIRSSFKRTKSEPESDYNDGMETCSQIVYNYNTERPQKDAGWRAAICPDYCPNMYEEMQTLANVLQSDIGRDMRVHDSTFLWFIPFVQSLMDLKDLGIAYIGEVIHYLCSEITGILNERIQQCDKVSEFFLLILVSIIELHRNKRCLHLLWISSRKWVEAVNSLATKPSDFRTGGELEDKCEAGSITPMPLATPTRLGFSEHVYSSDKTVWSSKPVPTKETPLECPGSSKSEPDSNIVTSDQEQPNLNDLVKPDCKEYFKRGNNSVVKKEEDFVKVVSEDNTLTDSQIDRDLSKLSLAAKVKGAVKSSSGQRTKSPCDPDRLDDQIITISDSSDEEKKPKAPSSPLSLEDYTQAMEATQDYSTETTREYKPDSESASADSNSEEANLIEKQIENTSHQKEADKGAVAKDFTQGSKLPEPGPSTSKMTLASKLAYKKNSTSPQQNIRKSKSGRSMPAVVPPKKVRPCPAPESTAESCCLKKGPRKAIELSQGSLDRIAKLRSHGLSLPSSTSAAKDEPSGRGSIVQPECEKTISKENGDPVDMELCSEEESVKDTTVDGKNPEKMDTAESPRQNESSATVKSFSRDLEDVQKLPPASKSKVNAAKAAMVRPPNWTYDMFASCSQFGPPSHLLQSVVAPVPVQFQGYSDYFNTFFPLMMLNAFETLAQEWIENQRVRERSYYFCLQNFCADLNRADFTAHFQESDLAKQLHPKEDDLIFLVVQKRKDTFREESEVENLIMSHVGLVTRFSRASGCLSRQQEHHTACHLSVQTRGNLSPFLNQQVKCVVVGSLVTTHRMFKGLLLLNRSPLAKPIINPSYNDFCPRDLLVASENAALDMNEYNEDQKRAIETAYAMVKQHPGLPKICLIHGPPGTGKSKTIVGLLSRVLKENTRNEKTTQKTNSKMKPNRFLVCAPSNAAVDELMKKIIVAFKEKCQNKQEPLGNCGDIRLVRLGAEKAINSEVRRFSLDKQVEHRMKRRPADCDWDIQKRKAALDQELDRLSRQRARDRCEKRESHMLADEISRLAKERQQLASQIKEVRGHSQKVQADIILEADIICCTLSTSGGGLLESTFARQRLDPFSCVIVDEAGQSCEVETLIPLIHRCNKLVLVGDPRQLPPTVKSVKAQDYGYDQSLMARLHQHLEQQVQNNILRNLPVVQLTVQYRMHPDICLFPSSYVYGRTLKTDKATEENRCSSEWPFQPYLIFDVGDGREERDNDSFSNPQEVKLVMELIRTIKEKRKDLGLRRIGIITPYSAQKKKIQEQLDRVYRNDSPGEVDTVDAFQGREKDCIIVTCVRANSTKGSIGFLASLQRLNVTITRARYSLFILGRLKTLMENKDWNELIQDAHRRGAIIQTSEISYRKDAVKILKLKPTIQPPTEPVTRKPLPAASSSSKRGEHPNPRDLTGTQGSRAHQQPQSAQAADSRRGGTSAPMEAAAVSTDHEKPRDPRLASLASRTESKGKESALGDRSSARSNPGSTSQQGHGVSSAARNQISRTESFKRPQQTMGQCDAPSAAPYAARHEGGWRAAASTSSLKAPGEGGQSTSGRWNRDCHSLTRRTSEELPEDADSNTAKRRKTIH